MCQSTFAAATADNLSYRFTCCKGRKLAQIKKREIPLNWTTECSRFESVCFFRCFFSVQSLPALPIDIWARCAAVQLKTTSFFCFLSFQTLVLLLFFLFLSKLLSLGKEERKKSSHFGFGFLLKKKTAAVNEVCLLQNEQTNSEREKKKTENSERCLFVLQQRQWQFKIKDRFFLFLLLLLKLRCSRQWKKQCFFNFSMLLYNVSLPPSMPPPFEL